MKAANSGVKMQEEKREIPVFLKKILSADVQLTDTIVKYVERHIPAKQKLKTHCKMLEISCHGVPWITTVLAFIWILNNRSLYQMQVNLMLGLILDIVVVAVIKAIARRRRPAPNDDLFSMGPDKYSFPSGHATRAAFVFYYFANVWPIPSFYILFLFIWCIAVTISRILMRRHYILDVCAGVFIGFCEAMFIHFIFLEPGTCLSLISWLTDEKLDGAEYDV